MQSISANKLPASSHPGESNQILGINLWSHGLEELVARSLSAVESRGEGQPLVFACANPHSLAVAEADSEFKTALRAADAVVADGVGLTVVARTVYGIPALPRITGSDYFQGVMQALNERGGRVAFLGSKPEVLRLVEERCSVQYPRVHIAATISPPFGSWSEDLNESYLESIRAADVDALWVGMTAPKQEKWTQMHRERIHAGVVGSIGAVFDYFAGTVQRAPQWLCRAGFEWAYRLAREPARLWERNIISGPRFIGLALRDRLTHLRAATAGRSRN
jgi:N-acetylglucosaminyldiphosphoundecaprenol N-acetyl-beta-D-mannosaminyltransferase